jgi:hypothetical protein
LAPPAAGGGCSQPRGFRRCEFGPFRQDPPAAADSLTLGQEGNVKQLTAGG